MDTEKCNLQMMTAEDGEVIFALLSDGVAHKSKSSSLCSWKAVTIIVMSFTVVSID
jgi:hypothetical protein